MKAILFVLAALGVLFLMGVIWALLVGFGVDSSLLPWLLIAVTLYFLPYCIARIRHHSQAMPILILNLFLGWTFLGWVILLAWSFSNNRQSAAAVHLAPPA